MFFNGLNYLNDWNATSESVAAEGSWAEGFRGFSPPLRSNLGWDCVAAISFLRFSTLSCPLGWVVKKGTFSPPGSQKHLFLKPNRGLRIKSIR